LVQSVAYDEQDEPERSVPLRSGKKYKKCHLEKDQAAERAELTSVAAKRAAAEQAQSKATREAFEASQALDAASNAVVDLVHAGQLDEAERAARELLERYPEVPDGHERLGMVYEARGDHPRAADCYRKVIEFIERIRVTLIRSTNNSCFPKSIHGHELTFRTAAAVG